MNGQSDFDERHPIWEDSTSTNLENAAQKAFIALNVSAAAAAGVVVCGVLVAQRAFGTASELYQMFRSKQQPTYTPPEFPYDGL